MRKNTIIEKRIKPEKGQVYKLVHYATARYEGMVDTTYGFLWNFTSLENDAYVQQSDKFSLPYDARGLLIEEARDEK